MSQSACSVDLFVSRKMTTLAVSKICFLLFCKDSFWKWCGLEDRWLGELTHLRYRILMLYEKITLSNREIDCIWFCSIGFPDLQIVSQFSPH